MLDHGGWLTAVAAAAGRTGWQVRPDAATVTVAEGGLRLLTVLADTVLATYRHRPGSGVYQPVEGGAEIERLIAVSVTTGQVPWTAETAANRHFASLSAAGTRVYTVAGPTVLSADERPPSARLTAYDRTTGREAWHRETPGHFTGLAAAPEAAYVATSTGTPGGFTAAALNARTGGP